MRYAEEHDLAVVMPSGDNSFYVDHPEAMNNYGKFVGKELVELTRKMFPLSRKMGRYLLSAACQWAERSFAKWAEVS